MQQDCEGQGMGRPPSQTICACTSAHDNHPEMSCELFSAWGCFLMAKSHAVHAGGSGASQVGSSRQRPGRQRVGET